ncbi:MAG: VOC family protein [Chitinophagaceae bacterium]
MKIPNSHQTVMPYLIVAGAENFISFTQKVFNAEEIFKRRRENETTIMHAEIKIGDCTIMFADTTAVFKPQLAGLFIYVENADETYHKALAEGGTTVMELSDQDYGRTCGVNDPCGNTWWITSVK